MDLIGVARGVRMAGVMSSRTLRRTWSQSGR
eukprot:SAG25_NODE_2583_length_1515_cov_4.945621_4_plen_30_part_01